MKPATEDAVRLSAGRSPGCPPHRFDNRLGGRCMDCGRSAREVAVGEEEVETEAAMRKLLEAAHAETSELRKAELAGERFGSDLLRMILR